ncbi:MAG: hypothetical protein P9E24_15895 [Candidatus Competibacter sp.]|nr:hypothetical protein [Candidatus Competibacter sp.]MDG4583081.1 hypothetical protein [Candidatus Competibacter sp.]
MQVSQQIHTVCPHCKRPVAVIREQPYAHCAEHGNVVPMRSAVANPPLPHALLEEANA